MRIHKTFDREELKVLSSEQLDKMLHEELDKQQKDDALILMLLDLLEEREMGEPSPEPGEAWQVFVERYNTPIAPEPTVRKKRSYRWIGGVAAAIAIFFLVSFGIPKVAGRNNIVQLIASWTDDFFYLSSPDKPPAQNEYVFETDNPGLQQVYDAVVELGITDPVVPTWLPDGYELVEIKFLQTADGEKICTCFRNGVSCFTAYYNLTSDPKESSYPKNADDVSVIELGGAAIFVLSNNENTVAVWNTNNAECFITTDEDKKTTIVVLKSIFSGVN